MQHDHHLPPTAQEQWDGMERRAAGILDQFKRELTSHTRDEMERYGEIIDRLDSTDERLAHIERSQAAMNQSLQAFIEANNATISEIQKAFPKDEDGKPGYVGHKTAHVSWMANAADEKEVMAFVRKQMKAEEKSDELLNYTKKVIFAGAAFAVVSFIAIATWAAFLKGPM